MTTTVRELIEQLQKYPPLAAVLLQDEYTEEYCLHSIDLFGNELVINIKNDHDERNRIDNDDDA